MGSFVREHLQRRPWWMNFLLLICFVRAAFVIPSDFFFTPVAFAEEVWFGILFTGWAAKLTEPLHWAIFAAGAYGFWRMSPWMWPWAAVYTAQVAFSSLVWSIFHVGGLGGWALGLVTGLLVGLLAFALWNARDRFTERRVPMGDRYGGWAVVTGASAGIGAEFARAFAREGMPCVLVARREDRLRELANELEQRSRVETRIVAADLSTMEGIQALMEAVDALDVGALVNNAGFGHAGRFDGQDHARLEEMVRLNCIAPVSLTCRILPKMKARGRGAVIITGSVAGAAPVPFNAAYSATKAFDRHLGEALWAEMRGTGVDVLVLEPGPTETEFQVVAGETAHPGEPADRVVALAFEALGRQPSIVSGWFNWAQAVAGRLVPRSLLTLVAGRVMEQWVPPERT
jgi:short-subunit dehydrogenase